MRVLVTGHHGYIGSILVPLFVDAGHEVVGLDMFLYEGCDFGKDRAPAVPVIRRDVRDVSASDFDGFDAVVHLAALSNDPLGDLAPECA
jgi:nucleoside-diphosphate-sugar epimerase